MAETKNKNPQNNILTNILNIILIIFLVLIAGLLLTAMGYFLGNLFPLKNIDLFKSASPSPQAEVTHSEKEEEVAEEPVEEGGVTRTKTINAYKQDFKFDYPQDWEVKVENTEFSTGVIISKGDFMIFITQGDMGASRCIYPDEADYSGSWEGPYVKYIEYAQFQGVNEIFRRTEHPVQGVHTVCSKRPDSLYYNGYSTVGFIKYQTPIYTPEAQLQELDEIVKTMVAL